jgi:hypothetical protein
MKERKQEKEKERKKERKKNPGKLPGRSTTSCHIKNNNLKLLLNLYLAITMT